MSKPIEFTRLLTENRISNERHSRELAELHEGWKLREAELLAHIKRLDQIISECATAVGATARPDCSIGFKVSLPGEIKAKIERLEKAVEFGGYMATSAKQFIDAVHAHDMAIDDDLELAIQDDSEVTGEIRSD